MLGSLHLEEGFLFARGLGVVDAAGEVRFAARVDKQGAARVDLFHGPGEANIGLSTDPHGGYFVIADAAGVVRLGGAVHERTSFLGLHGTDGEYAIRLGVDGTAPRIRVAKPTAADVDGPEHGAQAGYL